MQVRHDNHEMMFPFMMRYNILMQINNKKRVISAAFKDRQIGCIVQMEAMIECE